MAFPKKQSSIVQPVPPKKTPPLKGGMGGGGLPMPVKGGGNPVPGMGQGSANKGPVSPAKPLGAILLGIGKPVVKPKPKGKK